MPISATGTRPPERGFTLVEMMVVVLLIGLATTLVMLSLPAGGARLDDEAAQLAARIQHAREEAILTNRAVEIVLARTDSHFRVQRQGRWVPLETGPFRPRYWGEGLGVSLKGSSGVDAVRFDSSGGTDPATIFLSARGRMIELRVSPQGQVRIHDPV